MSDHERRHDLLQSIRRTMLYVSVPGAVAIACTTYGAGYLHGWFVFEGSGPYRTGVAILIAIIIGFLFRVPYRLWKNWLDAQPEEELANAIMDGMDGSSKPTVVSAQSGSQSKPANAFDQNDFDEATRVLLLKMVKQARKDGLPYVPGQQFFNTVLKSIH